MKPAAGGGEAKCAIHYGKCTIHEYFWTYGITFVKLYEEIFCLKKRRTA